MREWLWSRLSVHGNYEFFVKFAKGPPYFASKMKCIVEGCFLTVRKEVFLSIIRFRLWTIRSTDGCVSWYLNAATMTAATVLHWTMERNVSAFKVFPIRFSANGSAVLSCRWMSRWKRSFCSGMNSNAAWSVVSHSSPVPTGPDTASSVQRRFTACLLYTSRCV